MKKVNYISHLLEENVEEVKALSLYFDEITIVEQRHMHILAPEKNAKIIEQDGRKYIEAEVVTTRDFTDPKFLLHLNEFEKRNLINYRFDIDSGGEPR